MTDTHYIDQQIQVVKTGTTDSVGVVQALATLGTQVFDHVVEAIITSTDAEALALRQIIYRMDDNAITTDLIGLLSHTNRHVRATAFAKLGQARHPLATQPLVDIVQHATRSTVRALAAQALGNHGDTSAIPPLLNVLTTVMNDETQYDAKLVIHLIVALAKLGDHSRDNRILPLIDDEADVKIHAVKALKYLVFPELFQTLVRLTQEEVIEWRIDALEAILYLGTKDCIALCGALATDEIPDVATRARAYVHGLTGFEMANDDHLARWGTWWDSYQQDLQTHTCYFWHAPIELSRMLMHGTTFPALAPMIRNAMVVMTGQHFGLPEELIPTAADEARWHATALQWVSTYGRNFQPGHLYKYGHEMNIEDIKFP
jgi:hypothetical protein